MPEEIKKDHPQIPWRDVAGLRDKAIHSYFGINPERIWTVVKEDLPELRKTVKKALEK